MKIASVGPSRGPPLCTAAAYVLILAVTGPLNAFTVTPAEQRLQAACIVLLQLWVARVPEGTQIESLATVAADWADIAEERMERIKPGYDQGALREGIT